MTRVTRAGKYVTLSAAAKASPPRPSTFDALYRAEVGFVWRTVRFFGVPAADVEDVAHEVFIVVQRRFGDLDVDRSPRAWLAGIARRVVMHHQRSHSRAARKKAALAAVPTTPADDPQEVVSRRQAAALVRRFLDSLDAPRREVFVLIELEGMTAREVADVVGVNPNTVASRLRSARDQFKRFASRREDHG